MIGFRIQEGTKPHKPANKINRGKSMINMKNNISKLTQKTTGRVIQSVLLLIHDYANYV